MDDAISKNLTVIIGAGASHDCVEAGVTDFNENYRPPLTKDLFSYKDSFNRILKSYPKAEALSDEIRTKLSNKNVSLETLLKELQSERDLELKKQYWQIPLYLQELLGTVSNHFVHTGATKFDRLIKVIWKSGFEKVILLTLNYDLFIEKALQSFGYQFHDSPSYITKNKKFSLIKLHGSVNWGRKLLNSVNTTGSAVAILDSLQEDLKLGSGIHVLRGYEDRHRFTDGHFYYPAIAVPVEGKGEFVCPKEHLQAVSTFLMSCTNFLVIGFSGSDQYVLDQLKLVSDVDTLMIINEDKKPAQEVFEKLIRTNHKFFRRRRHKNRNPLYTDGFKNFVRNYELERFLQT